MLSLLRMAPFHSVNKTRSLAFFQVSWKITVVIYCLHLWSLGLVIMMLLMTLPSRLVGNHFWRGSHPVSNLAVVETTIACSVFRELWLLAGNVWVINLQNSVSYIKCCTYAMCYRCVHGACSLTEFVSLVLWSHCSLAAQVLLGFLCTRFHAQKRQSFPWLAEGR